MNRLHVFIVPIVLLVGCARGPALQSLGTAGSLEPAPGFDISPERAVELAQPHLDESFELRRQHLEPDRRSGSNPPIDHVNLKGDTYYIARDNYPAIKAGFYLPYAVKVNANTGEVTLPSEKSKKAGT